MRDKIARQDRVHEECITQEYGLKSALVKAGAKPTTVKPVKGNKPSLAGECRN